MSLANIDSVAGALETALRDGSHSVPEGLLAAPNHCIVSRSVFPGLEENTPLHPFPVVLNNDMSKRAGVCVVDGNGVLHTWIDPEHYATMANLK